MKFSVGIETKDRTLAGGQNYLGQTLRNFRRAGGFDEQRLEALTIVVDGESSGALCHEFDDETLQDHRVQILNASATRQQNAMRAIKHALNTECGTQRNVDYVIKLEDDLDFCGDFLGSLERWLTDFGHANVPMFALGASFEIVSRSKFNGSERTVFDAVTDESDPSFPMVREAMRRGESILPHRVGGWWGAQALVFTPADAAQLVEFLGDDPKLFDGKKEHRSRGHDLLLQVWGQSRGAKYFGVTVPSFVQHVGYTSNLSEPEINHVQPFFQFPWAGPDWSYQSKVAR